MANRLVRRFLCGGIATVAAFLAGATTPREAGAHCGDHAGSCDETIPDYNAWCDYSTSGVGCDGCGIFHTYTHHVVNNCTGTCYNGGTAGCCSSPEACANEPCKPGGCGSECWSWDSDETVYYPWDCGHCPIC